MGEMTKKLKMLLFPTESFFIHPFIQKQISMMTGSFLACWFRLGVDNEDEHVGVTHILIVVERIIDE